MPKTQMISLQISQDLMGQFDAVWEKMNLSSRSEALRQSILTFIEKNQESSPLEGHKVAVITLHHGLREDILDKFTELTDRYEPIIKSINQYNLKNYIVKTMIISGPAEEIREFFNILKADRLFSCSISYILLEQENPDDQVKEKEADNKND